MMTSMINKIPVMRAQALEMDAVGNALTRRSDRGKSKRIETPIYANPFRPEVCVVLDLAIFFFCKQHRGDDNAVFIICIQRIRLHCRDHVACNHAVSRNFRGYCRK